MRLTAKASSDDGHLVGELLHLPQAVARDEHGVALGGEPTQQVPHGDDAGRIEAVRRLVEEAAGADR